MSPYIHNLPEWPQFQWGRERLEDRLRVIHHEQGRLLGRMEGLGFKARQEAVLVTDRTVFPRSYQTIFQSLSQIRFPPGQPTMGTEHVTAG